MAQTEGPMTVQGAVRAFNDGVEIFAIWLGTRFVWPDPWTDIWDEGSTVYWDSAWHDAWSASYTTPIT